MDWNPKRGSYDLGDSIASLRAEVKAMHAPIPVSHHPYQLQDHAAQAGSTPTENVNPARAAPVTTLGPRPSDMYFVLVARNLCDTFVRGQSLPNIHVCSQGERSAQDPSVLFRDNVERCLAYVETGVYCLQPDVQASD